jgi:uncharacterized membrane protein
MSTGQLRVAGAGLFALLIFLSGFWLNRSGKPYNGIIFNIHKLIALAAVILFVITLYRTNQMAGVSPVELVASVVTGLFILGLFVTGALLSIDKPMPAIVLQLHHITPYLALLSTAATFFLLLSRKS